MELVPTRDRFAEIISEAFANADPCTCSQVTQWVFSGENCTEGWVHYHMAVKLSARRRWLQSYLEQRHHINVNFSDRHSNYYSAWHYTTKEDDSYVQSQGHPGLSNASEPSTSSASRARWAGGHSMGNTRKGKKR